MSLETAFKNYLRQIVGAKDLDELPEDTFPRNKADFFLETRRSIFEVKSISSDRADALVPWLKKKIETRSEIKNGMPVLFGGASLWQIHRSHANKALFENQLDYLAARTLEDYIRSAKRQIYETKKALGCDAAFGFLVILNEGHAFYETWFVYRMIQGMLIDVKNSQPDLRIDGVWYINESAIQNGIVDIVFIHESEEIEDITPNEILDEMNGGWIIYRGYKTT